MTTAANKSATSAPTTSSATRAGLIPLLTASVSVIPPACHPRSGDHMATPWRTTPLPADWQAIRRRILDRDGHRCTAVIDGARCPRPARDVDHVTPAHLDGPDTDDNLASLCAPHHRAKTAREARRAQLTRTGTLARPAETHPGLTGPTRT